MPQLRGGTRTTSETELDINFANALQQCMATPTAWQSYAWLLPLHCLFLVDSPHHE